MKHAAAALSLMLVAAGLSAITAKVVDTEGPATVQRVAGKAEKVAIGKSYTTGDSIRTGKNGLVELSQDGLTIRIGPSTVFTLLEKEQGGRPRGVLAVTLGSVKMKYDRLTGSEPMIQSSSCIAGVRGTELTIWAAADGASQLIVDSGLVTVEAFGKAVDLGPDEAVEVVNGQPPGDKYMVPKERPGYESWDTDRIKALLAEPLATLAGMRERLAYYALNVAEFRNRYLDVNARLKAARQTMIAMKQEQGADAAAAYENDVVTPLMVQNGGLVLNYRYFGVVALSMRRFVGSRMYLMLKVMYATTPEDPVWMDFLDQYAIFVNEFEKSIMPVLVDADF